MKRLNVVISDTAYEELIGFKIDYDLRSLDSAIDTYLLSHRGKVRESGIGAAELEVSQSTKEPAAPAPSEPPEKAQSVAHESRRTRQPSRKVSVPLKRQPAKITKIIEIWEAGERNRTEIARKVGVHPDAVTRWIAAEIEAGRLVE